MFSRILCPIDFSEASRQAVQYAIALAKVHGASLDVLHVSPPPGTPALVPGEPDEEGLVEAHRVTAEAAAMVESASQQGIRVDVLVQSGQPTKQILQCAAARPADVIVMGTHGTGGFEHFVLGSVAEKVVRKATCPVFTVPPHARLGPAAAFGSLVCAIDFSEWSIAALDEACALAQPSGGTVAALHVIEWPWHESPTANVDGLSCDQAAALLEYRRYQENLAKARLDAVVGEVARRRCPIETCVTHGTPYVELLCAIERRRADVLVMGVHGRSALDVFFFGSTTHQVVRRAPCPVLTLRH